MRRLYDLNNARTPEIRTVMEKLQAEDVCNFCPGNEHLGAMRPVLREGPRWTVRHNAVPLDNTRLHLLLVAKRHTLRLADLEPDDMLELLDHLKWIEQNFQLEGGGFVMRFGEMKVSTASVQHQHAQLICAAISDQKDPNYEKVFFRVG